MIDLVAKEIYRLSQDEGLNDTEIANAIGVSRATVNRTRKQYKIPRANLNNKKDKVFVCAGCKDEVFIRRNQRRQLYCEKCTEAVRQDVTVQS